MFDTNGIRAHYRDDPHVDVKRIPHVDFPLQTANGSIQTLAEAADPAAPYRWVLASHVIEHVPDLIGWLADIAQVLEDGGRLILAIPDHRFTFDSLRPPTTVRQMIQAHLAGDRTPALRAVFDHFRSAVHLSSPERWAGRPVGDADVIHGLAEALAKTEIARTGEYVDCHVWLFTPGEFVAQMNDLGELGLTDLYVSAVVPTASDEIVYYAALSRMPRYCTAAEAARTRDLATRRVLESLGRAPEPSSPASPTSSTAGPASTRLEIPPPVDPVLDRSPAGRALVESAGGPADTEAPRAAACEPSPNGPGLWVLSGREATMIATKRRLVAGVRRLIGNSRA